MKIIPPKERIYFYPEHDTTDKGKNTLITRQPCPGISPGEFMSGNYKLSYKIMGSVN